MAWSLAAALQFLWQLPDLCQSGFRFRPAWQWASSGIAQDSAVNEPRRLSAARRMQINLMVNTNFASRIVDPLRGSMVR